MKLGKYKIFSLTIIFIFFLSQSIFAEDKTIWITYPDGKSSRYKNFIFSPKVLDGSIINVGTKEEIVPFNVTEYFKDLTLIVANLTQVILLYNALSNFQLLTAG